MRWSSRRRWGLGPGAGLLASLGVVGVLLGDAGRRIGRMRRAGRRVPALDHELELPGTAPQRTVTILGDSAAAGHGLAGPEEAIARRVGRSLHERDGRGTVVRCLAVDGATTREVRTAQLPAVAASELVVVGVGVNDAVDPRTALRASVAELDLLLHDIRDRQPEATIVLLSCPDLSVAPGLPRLVRPWVGRRCRQLAARQAAVAHAHAVPVVAAPRERLAPALFGPDGFHPGAAGHAELADAVIEVVPATERAAFEGGQPPTG